MISILQRTCVFSNNHHPDSFIKVRQSSKAKEEVATNLGSPLAGCSDSVDDDVEPHSASASAREIDKFSVGMKETQWTFQSPPMHTKMGEASQSGTDMSALMKRHALSQSLPAIPALMNMEIKTASRSSWRTRTHGEIDETSQSLLRIFLPGTFPSVKMGV